MPNRILRERILTSDAVNRLSPGAEVFYRRLMSVVDDFGRYDARPVVLLADLFKLQLDRVTISDILDWLTDCINNNLVVAYTIDDKPFLVMLRFRQRTRARESRWPNPPDDVAAQISALDDGHATGTGGSMTVTRPSGDRQVTASAGTKTDTDTDTDTKTDTKTLKKRARRSGGLRFFDKWYERYPNKRGGKPRAKSIWQRQNLDDIADDIIAALDSQIAWRQRQAAQGQFVPNWCHAPVWLNGARWTDDTAAEGKPASIAIINGEHAVNKTLETIKSDDQARKAAQADRDRTEALLHGCDLEPLRQLVVGQFPVLRNKSTDDPMMRSLMAAQAKKGKADD